MDTSSDHMSRCSYYDSALFNTTFSKSSPNFSAVHINARSIKNKKDEIDQVLRSLTVHFDALLFSETWLASDDAPPTFDNMCRMINRNPKKKGGGVAVYLRDGLSCRVAEDFSTTKGLFCLFL